MIVKRTGAADRFLHLNTNRGRLSIATAGQTHGHSTVNSVGAYGVAATPAVGPFPNPFSGVNTVETFSSDGPRRIFYNADSSAITPGNVSSTGGLVLAKPDITAADCVATTTPGFSPFCGTYAAAPHAAAIAALLKSAPNNPGAGQVLAAMFATALDVSPAGWDRNSGVGIVMANAALGALTTIPATDFYTVNPCRVIDTRLSGGAITCGTERAITVVGGTCGIPSGANAVTQDLVMIA